MMVLEPFSFLSALFYFLPTPLAYVKKPKYLATGEEYYYWHVWTEGLDSRRRMLGSMLEGEACNSARDRWRGSIHGTSSCGLSIINSQTVNGIVVEHVKCQWYEWDDCIHLCWSNIFSGTGCIACIYVLFITIIIHWYQLMDHNLRKTIFFPPIKSAMLLVSSVSLLPLLCIVHVFPHWVSP